MGRLIGQFQPDSPAWHAARSGCIGGSDIGAVCGWSPYVTREKLLRLKAGVEPDRQQTASMQRGQLLEGPIMAWLAGKHGLDVDCQPGTFVHDRLDWALYNPDGVADGVLLEAKTTADRSTESGWGRAGSDKVPLCYQAQVQWGMEILGLDICYLGVLHGATNSRPDLSFSSYKIKRDPDIFTFMLRKAEIFMTDLTALQAQGSAA